MYTANEARVKAFSHDVLLQVDANAASAALTMVHDRLMLVNGGDPRTISKWRESSLMAEPRFTFAPVYPLHTLGWIDDRFDDLGIQSTPGALAFDWLAGVRREIQKWAYWAGDKGLGKTHLASVLAQHWTVATGKSALVIQWADFLNKIQETFAYSSARDRPEYLRDVSLQRAIASPFLVVDDVTVGHSVTTPWALEKLWTLCDKRIKRPTIFTSNLTISAWERELGTLAAQKRGLVDVVEKIVDRFGSGPGGNVGSFIAFVSKEGSMRKRGAHG